MKIIILNGPNLNLLGKREPGIYGNQDFETFFEELQKVFPGQLEYYQSNVEGELINKLHEVGFGEYGIVLNAGGYSHTSVALSDAVAAIQAPVVEVHISNVYAREAYRHNSLLSKYCKGVIVGFGLTGYKMAIEWLLNNFKK
jgi:3-dehydroquinate dehydratase-2